MFRLYASCTYFLYSSEKSAKHVLFFISEGILDQISIASLQNSLIICAWESLTELCLIEV